MDVCRIIKADITVKVGEIITTSKFERKYSEGRAKAESLLEDIRKRECLEMLGRKNSLFVFPNDDKLEERIFHWARTYAHNPTSSCQVYLLDLEVDKVEWHDSRYFEKVALSWFDAGARSIYTIDKIDTLSDLEGKVIRTQENDKMEEIFSLLGASTIQIPYGSVYSELMKNTIDGAENNFPSYMYTGHSDVARFVFLDEHMRLPEIMVMSRKAMEEISELDESLLDVIKEAAIAAGEYERELWREEEEKAKRDAIIKGCVVTYPSFDELEKWKDAVSPIYDSLDPESKRIVEEIKSLDQ